MTKENIMSHHPIAGSALLLGLVASSTFLLVTADVLAHFPFFAY
jgi:hypothetical protein